MLRLFGSEIESNLRKPQNCDSAWQHAGACSTISAQSELSVSRQKQFSASHNNADECHWRARDIFVFPPHFVQRVKKVYAMMIAAPFMAIRNSRNGHGHQDHLAHGPQGIPVRQRIPNRLTILTIDLDD
jgi:hypothetical protein